MNFWKNTQMVITTVLLLLAAACPLFEKDISVPYLFTLRFDPPATTPHQLPDQRAFSTGSGETVNQIVTSKEVDQDFLSFETINFDSLAKVMHQGKQKVALVGMYRDSSLESGKRLTKRAGNSKE